MYVTVSDVTDEQRGRGLPDIRSLLSPIGRCVDELITWSAYGNIGSYSTGSGNCAEVVPYSQRYLFNAMPDTNHNANPTNPNRYSEGNPNATNPNTEYRCE